MARSRLWFGALTALVSILGGCATGNGEPLPPAERERRDVTEIGDRVWFVFESAFQRDPKWSRLSSLTKPQPVGLDGSIFVPYVGSVYVVGMTSAELSEAVASLLRGVTGERVPLVARLVPVGA